VSEWAECKISAAWQKWCITVPCAWVVCLRLSGLLHTYNLQTTWFCLTAYRSSRYSPLLNNHHTYIWPLAWLSLIAVLTQLLTLSRSNNQGAIVCGRIFRHLPYMVCFSTVMRSSDWQNVYPLPTSVTSTAIPRSSSGSPYVIPLMEHLLNVIMFYGHQPHPTCNILLLIELLLWR